MCVPAARFSVWRHPVGDCRRCGERLCRHSQLRSAPDLPHCCSGDAKSSPIRNGEINDTNRKLDPRGSGLLGRLSDQRGHLRGQSLGALTSQPDLSGGRTGRRHRGTTANPLLSASADRSRGDRARSKTCVRPVSASATRLTSNFAPRPRAQATELTAVPRTDRT